jgi:hypothetical protein
LNGGPQQSKLVSLWVSQSMRDNSTECVIASRHPKPMAGIGDKGHEVGRQAQCDEAPATQRRSYAQTS